MKKIILSLLLSSYSVLACDGGIVPHNSLKIPVNSIYANQMTQEQFKNTIKRFENFFSPRVDRDHNSELIIFNSWQTNTVNAFAEKAPGKVMITVYGGLARHSAMTTDSLMLTLCHELGHHFGGYPKKTSNIWSSAEGQADYYATTKCLRRIWEKDDNAAIVASAKIPEMVQKECMKSFKAQKEVAVCIRMSLAAKSMALLFQDLDHDSIEPKFETPETEVARAMNYMHPFSQCRLDTYFQGAICSVDESVEFDDHDERQGACHKKLGYERGLRPRCWFVPRN